MSVKKKYFALREDGSVAAIKEPSPYIPTVEASGIAEARTLLLQRLYKAADQRPRVYASGEGERRSFALALAFYDPTWDEVRLETGNRFFLDGELFPLCHCTITSPESAPSTSEFHYYSSAEWLKDSVSA